LRRRRRLTATELSDDGVGVGLVRDWTFLGNAGVDRGCGGTYTARCGSILIIIECVAFISFTEKNLQNAIVG
jgi:hypothetical protein